MGKLKIEPGVSRIKRAKLQSSIDQTIAQDIELMAQWSDNETNYIINELLRFAIAQAEDFQKYKAGLSVNGASGLRDAATIPAATKSDAAPVPATAKADAASMSTGARVVATPAIQSDRPVVATAVHAAKEGASHAS